MVYPRYKIVLIEPGLEDCYFSDSWLWCKWKMFWLDWNNIAAVWLERNDK